MDLCLLRETGLVKNLSDFATHISRAVPSKKPKKKKTHTKTRLQERSAILRLLSRENREKEPIMHLIGGG